MRLLRPRILAFLSAFALSGCGTVANFASLKPKVYGGIARDLEVLSSLPGIGPISNPKAALLLVAIPALVGTELCCTALGDTVTLPLTKVLDSEWRLKEAEKPPPELRQPPTAFGVNGPYLWDDATEQPKAPKEGRSKEAENPLPEPAGPPIAFGVDWPDLGKKGTEWPTDGGDSSSR